MNSSWRRHFLNTLPVFHHDQRQEQGHLEELNQYVKLLRRKEDLLYRASDVQRRNDQHIDVNIHLGLLRKELDHQRIDEQSLLRKLQESNCRITSKTALYSVFSRVVEILEISKQRFKAFDNHMAELVEAERRSLCENYNRMLGEGNYDAIALINIVSRLGAQRMACPFEQRQTIEKEEKDGFAVTNKKRATSEALLKVTKSWSKPVIPNFLEILSSRKLELEELKKRKSKKKLETRKAEPPQTEKRSTEEREQLLNFVERLRKSNKVIKPKPKKIFGMLYSVLEVRNIFLDEVYTERSSIKEVEDALSEDCISRNVSTQESVEQFRLSYNSYLQRLNQKAARSNNPKSRMQKNIEFNRALEAKQGNN